MMANMGPAVGWMSSHQLDLLAQVREEQSNCNAKEDTTQDVWEVVGGGGRGGIIVRSGRGLSSPAEAERLSTGAVVRALERENGRVRYELVSGTGPASGWVSMASEGKDLLVNAAQDQQDIMLRYGNRFGQPTEGKGSFLIGMPRKRNTPKRAGAAAPQGGPRATVGEGLESDQRQSGPKSRSVHHADGFLPTFGYAIGNRRDMRPRFARFDVRDEVCLRVGGFRHGQVVCDKSGLEFAVVGMKPWKGMPRLWFQPKKGAKASVRCAITGFSAGALQPKPCSEQGDLTQDLEEAYIKDFEVVEDSDGEELRLCQRCKLPLGDLKYSDKDKTSLHGECMAQYMLQMANEQEAARKSKDSEVKKANRVEYDIGWRASRVPRNVGAAQKLQCDPTPHGISCLVLEESTNSARIAMTVEPAAMVNLEYLAIALQVRRREGREPFFSLDPTESSPKAPMQTKRFEPEWLAGTSVSDVMFQADYHLKELSMGEYEQPVVGMRSCVDVFDTEELQREWRAREWFVVRQAEVLRSHDSVLVPEVTMGVEAREQECGPDGVEDKPITRSDHPLVKYAEAFTHNFDLIAERKSVIYHLRELAKASVMAKFLAEAGVNVDASWLNLVEKGRATCCMEVPQLWNENFRREVRVKGGDAAVPAGAELEMDTMDTSTSVYGGVQFGLDRFSLAGSRAGAPMARAASLSASMMQGPGVRAGISATMRSPGLSASLGARAGISATSLAPSVFPSAFRAAPGALRTARAGISAMSLAPSTFPSAFRAAPGGLREARGVDLNLDQFSLANTTKVQDDADAPHMDACVALGDSFWSAVDTASESPLKAEDRDLLKAVFHQRLSDRREEGDRFVPPDPSAKYVEHLRTLVKEERAVCESRKKHFLSEGFAADSPGPLFPPSWAPRVKVTHGRAAAPAGALRARPEYAAEADLIRSALQSAEPIFDEKAEDGTRFRIYVAGGIEIRTVQGDGSEEEVGTVFSMA